MIGTAAGAGATPAPLTVIILTFNSTASVGQVIASVRALASRILVVDSYSKDDTVEAVTTRVQKYHSETAPIIPFYRAKGILRQVDGVGDPDLITQRLTAVLSS